MVDSGPGQQESVIDVTTRRRPAASDAAPATGAGSDGQAGDLLSLPFLMERLSSPSPQVTMWAAYQLVDRWQEACPRYIDALWLAPQEEIRESAISLIGKYKLDGYAFPMMRLFSSGDHPFRYAAGTALGRIGYEPVGKMLKRWFVETAADPDANPIELEAAAESLLSFDRETHWAEVFAQLGPCQQNHAFFSTLFGRLCLYAETPEQLALLADAYGKVREVFNDIRLTQHLVDMVGRANLCRYLQVRLNGGYRLNAVYQECLKVMGWELPDPELRALLDALAMCGNSREGIERFLPLAETLLTRLEPEPQGGIYVRAFLESCRGWVSQWDSAILRVRELEYHLIASLPLAALLAEVEAQCLAHPEQEALRITRIYQSPLLSPRFMAQVLNLIEQSAHRPGVAELGAVSYSGWVRDEEKDALWKLYTDQLEGVDYPLEQVLPQPWSYAVANLMERLVALLEKRFAGYLLAERRQAIDYSLEIFRRGGTTAVVDTLLPHFELLINHHYDGFVELMTHLPDARFLPALADHYREGEADLLRLIRFICDVHHRPYPDLPAAHGDSGDDYSTARAVRLMCRGCGGAYQYAPEVIFVDEERLEQRQIPTAREVWTPSRFTCKKCGAPVPFDPDDRFLSDLYGELLAARLYPTSRRDEEPGRNIKLIHFPVLDGKTLNPAQFLTEVERILESSTAPGQESSCLLELGRFKMEIGEVAEAKQTFQKIVAGPSNCPMALYYLGVIAFREKNLYEARVHFSRLSQSCAREDFGNALDNPVDMAHHYLKLLDKREFKRSHFHLITT